MTAVHILGLQEEDDGKGKTSSCCKTRRVTDKFWLVCLLTVFAIWISLLGHAIYFADNSAFPCQHTDRHATNTSCGDSDKIISSDVLHNLTVLMSSATHFLKTHHSFGDHYICHTMSFIRFILFIYFMTECYFLAIRIGRQCDNSVSMIHFSVHFIIVNMGWVIITALFFTPGLFSNYDDLYSQAYGGTFIWYIPALGTFSVILPQIMLVTFLRPIGTKHFVKGLRYYITCRFLIFFRLFIVVTMLLIIALNNALLKNLNRTNMTSLLFITIGSICTILFLNNYNKIITMAVICNRDWNEDKKAISFKEIAFATFTIGKYHLGTVFLNSLRLVRHIMLALQGVQKQPKPDVIEEHYGKKMDVASHVIKRSPILTAIHGHDFVEANTNMIWYELEEKVIFNYRSISSIIWKDISYIYFISYILVLLTGPIEDVEGVYAALLLVAIYLVIQIIYKHIVSIMDTIEFANDFYKVENKKSNQASDQKEPEAMKIEKTSATSEI